MIKVLVLVDYSSEFSRQMLKGLIRYSKSSGSWSFYRMSANYKGIYDHEEIIELVKNWQPNAVIVQPYYINPKLLTRLNVPIFLQNYKEESRYFSNIVGDYLKTGQLAAQYFSQKRFVNYAFYGCRDFIWSREREKGFAAEVLRNRGNYFKYIDKTVPEWGQDRLHTELKNWLLSLPKPIAIFACDDIFAIHIAEVCKRINLHIPNDIALLGVDNDELICNLSAPPISSIVLDAENGGYELAKKIEKVVVDQSMTPFSLCINPLYIEERESTGDYYIQNEYIKTVVNYLQKNFTIHIMINSLTDLVPLSRRNLETKFKHEMGISIYQFVLKLRIDYFKKLLTTTDLPLPEIVANCGFNDYSNVFKIFKKTTGYSPSEFRKKLSQSQPITTLSSKKY